MTPTTAPFAAENDPDYGWSRSLNYVPRRHAYQRTDEYLFSQLIPYIGSKRKLLPLIAEAIGLTGLNPEEAAFADLFAGSGVVSRMAKTMGFRVFANDWEPYAAAFNGAFVALDKAPLPPEIFEGLNSLAPIDGYMTQHFCPADDDAPSPTSERCFYTRANGMRIDAVRERIAVMEAEGNLTLDQKNYLLGPLLACASYVSNTSGVFKAFHAGWGGATGTALYRIKSDLKMQPPILRNNGRSATVTQQDALVLARGWPVSKFGPLDIAYIDPPYNQHPYGSNYHMLNTVALWDKPDVASFEMSKSAIRSDWRTERRSAYNSRREAEGALLSLIDALPCRWAIVSYSTDGNIDIGRLCVSMAERGRLQCLGRPYKRYRVSSQRMSPRARNVEFVLILDRLGKPLLGEGEQCLSKISALAGKL